MSTLVFYRCKREVVGSPPQVTVSALGLCFYQFGTVELSIKKIE